MTPIERARTQYQTAHRNLIHAIATQCNGDHTHRDHHDRNPPWCDHCGYDKNGRHHTPTPDTDRLHWRETDEWVTP